jgi:DNA-binding MarR family transcriptional regulator
MQQLASKLPLKAFTQLSAWLQQRIAWHLDYTLCGLRSLELEILEEAVRKPSLQQLIYTARVSRPAITQAVDKLVAKKLIRRVPTDQFGSRKAVELTEKGQQSLLRFRNQLSQEIAGKLKVLPSPARDTFCANLVRISNGLWLSHTLPGLSEARHYPKKSRY